MAHVYNHWSYMLPLAEQHKRMESFTAPFTVLRLLTRLKISYEAAKKQAEPYNKIVGELPEMRRDTVELVKKAVVENRRAYVLKNNRADRGSSSPTPALDIGFARTRMPDTKHATAGVLPAFFMTSL